MSVFVSGLQVLRQARCVRFTRCGLTGATFHAVQQTEQKPEVSRCDVVLFRQADEVRIICTRTEVVASAPGVHDEVANTPKPSHKPHLDRPLSFCTHTNRQDGAVRPSVLSRAAGLMNVTHHTSSLRCSAAPGAVCSARAAARTATAAGTTAAWRRSWSGTPRRLVACRTRRWACARSSPARGRS